MLWGAASGALELRATDGGVRLRGRFNYGDVAELQPKRYERIEARAFAERIDAGEEIHLLLGHDFNRPLASTRAGSLRIEDRDDALSFEAELSAEMGASTTGRDALAMIRGRLATGLSPGFIVRQDEVRETQRGGLLRTIRAADLHEISIVTRPAYQAAQVEARRWTPADPARTPVRHLRRWRA